MKRFLILSLAVMLCLSGCSQDALSGYIEALKKTGSITSGKVLVESSIDMEFDPENLTLEQRKTTQYLEQMNFTGEATYDNKGKGDTPRALALCYGKIGGMGMDTTVYMEGEEVSMYLPMMDGYLDLTGENYRRSIESSKEFSKIFYPVAEKLIELLTTKDIMKGKRTYITTEDGQIKTTIYTVNITESQMLELLEEIIRQMTKENVDIGAILGLDITLAEVIEGMQDWKEHFILSDFTSTAYVDFDGRLVKQVMDAVITFKNADTTQGPTKLTISAEVTFSGLGEKQDITIPEITPDMYLEEGWDELWN